MEVSHQDGKKETVTKVRLNYVRLKAVEWTSDRMTPEDRNAEAKEEALNALAAVCVLNVFDALIFSGKRKTALKVLLAIHFQTIYAETERPEMNLGLLLLTCFKV